MWYWLFRMLAIIILKLFFSFKVEGLNNLPQKTNFIVVANHSSFLDPLIVAAGIPKKIYCIVSRFLLRIPILNWSLGKLEVLPAGGISEKAIEFLMQNKIVGLFPEGGCSRDGKLREFKRGVAVLAIKTGRPIVPCAVLGSFQALPVSAKFPKFVPIKLKVGKPLYLAREFTEAVDDIYLQEGVFRIKNTIKELIDAG